MIGKRLISTTSKTLFFKRLHKQLVNSSPKEHIVEELSKPVGLDSPPNNNVTYDYGNSFKDMFNNEKTIKRTNELELEFSKSGLYDVYTFRKTNGKLFYSPPSFWRNDKSLYFPHLVGYNLVEKKNINVEDSLKERLSIVKISTSEIGDSLVNSYFISNEKDYLHNKDLIDDLNKGSKLETQIVQINLTENWAKMAIVRLSLGRIQKLIPKWLHDRFFICKRNQLPFMIREKLQINNLYTGYIAIVDPNLKIRWMGCGRASEEEFNLLWKCVRGLIKEFNK